MIRQVCGEYLTRSGKSGLNILAGVHGPHPGNRGVDDMSNAERLLERNRRTRQRAAQREETRP